jgi:hypothetical protein
MKTLHWHREPGKFINKNTGEVYDFSRFGGIGPQFTGTTREWYETLVETIIDLRNQLHEDAAGTLTGRENADVTVSVSPDVLCILESTVLFKPDVRKRTKKAGTLCGMKIIVSRSLPQFELQMELKANMKRREGSVVIVED